MDEDRDTVSSSSPGSAGERLIAEEPESDGAAAASPGAARAESADSEAPGPSAGGFGHPERIAFAALLVSAVTAVFSGVTWWSQKKAAELSLLPAVSLYHRVEVPLFPDRPDHDITTFMWKIENTGGGPAFVESAVLKVPGSGIKPLDSRDAWEAVQGLLAANLERMELVAYDNDPVGCPYAVRAGAEWPLYSVSVRGDASSALHETEKIEVALCYCSAHGDCFYVDSNSHTKEPLLECPSEIEAGDLLQGDACAA